MVNNFSLTDVVQVVIKVVQHKLDVINEYQTLDVQLDVVRNNAVELYQLQRVLQQVLNTINSNSMQSAASSGLCFC